MTDRLKSSALLRMVYRRHQVRRLIGLFVFLILFIIVSAQAFILSTALFDLRMTGVNALFCAIAALFAFGLIRFFAGWFAEGIGPRRFFQNWERRHPGVANGVALVVYSEREKAEIDRLGYSTELIQAEDSRLIGDLREMVNRRDEPGVTAPLALCALVIVPSLIALMVQPGFYQTQFNRISRDLFAESPQGETRVIQIEKEAAVPRGEAAHVGAQLQGEFRGGEAVLHRKLRTGWETQTAPVVDGRTEFVVPNLNRAASVYVSADGVLSNRGLLVPLDPPSITQGEIQITPPEYTHETPSKLTTWRSFSAPEGSVATLYGVASDQLTRATAVWRDSVYPIEISGDKLALKMEAHYTGDLRVQMTGVNGLTGESPLIRVTSIPDATPEIRIIEPEEKSDIPTGNVIAVQVHLKDDYGVRNLVIHSMLNDDENTRRTDAAWVYDESAAADIGRATDFYLTFNWDLTPFDMYPGDELSFYLEGYDEDPLHGPKAGRSDTHVVRYPSLMDLVDELNQTEETNLTDLNEVVEEQKKLHEDLSETIERISDKANQPDSAQEGEDPLWMEKREMESLKDRQQKLVDEAKKIEEQLSQYQDKASNDLTEEEKESQGFTPETLEKMTRVQDLMKEMLDQDSQQLMKKLEDTVNQMSDKVDMQKLNDLQFDVKDFEEQLDRTLSMLENTYQARQIEGLRQTTEELAERQDHLMRETSMLDKEAQQLQSDIQNMQQEAAQLQEQIQQQQAGLENQSGSLNDQSNQPGEQNQQESATGDNQKSPEEQKAELEAKQQQLEQLKKELEKKQNELKAKQDLMAERQERLKEDSQALMDRMQQMQQGLNEKDPAAAQQMKQMLEQLQESGALSEMQNAANQLRQNAPQQAMPHQQNALSALQQTTQQMQSQLAGMGMQDMQQDSRELKRLVDRGLFLSDELESLTESPLGQGRAQAALREANAFLRELRRIQAAWNGIAQTNPFMNRAAEKSLRRSESQLREAVDAGQGLKWVGLHEARQSLIALNQALWRMMQDDQQMQQQMQQQMGAQSLQQQMQQMIQQQQNLQQMLNQLRQQGEQGEKMAEQLKRMAEHQARIRKEIEKMMQQYRHARQLKNRLDGIYDEMREVERMLESGENGDKMEERQNRIMSRMLEAGTMQEEDEYGNERRGEKPKDVGPAEQASGDVDTGIQDRIRDNVERPPLESIPPAFRGALKNFYIHLSEQTIPG
ncbi:MAG: hypothetical protein GC154_01625 [bacterium]|nr:hypothetical protein [bacterium]